MQWEPPLHHDELPLIQGSHSISLYIEWGKKYVLSSADPSSMLDAYHV